MLATTRVNGVANFVLITLFAALNLCIIRKLVSTGVRAELDDQEAW